MHGLCGTLIWKMGVARLPTRARSFGCTFDARTLSDWWLCSRARCLAKATAVKRSTTLCYCLVILSAAKNLWLVWF